MVHVRFEGHSYDFPEAECGVNSSQSDREILQRLALHLEVALARMDGYVVDRSPSGDTIVRPEAVYG